MPISWQLLTIVSFGPGLVLGWGGGQLPDLKTAATFSLITSSIISSISFLDHFYPVFGCSLRRFTQDLETSQLVTSLGLDHIQPYFLVNNSTNFRQRSIFSRPSSPVSRHCSDILVLLAWYSVYMVPEQDLQMCYRCIFSQSGN